jgi:hypothetical protein
MDYVVMWQHSRGYHAYWIQSDSSCRQVTWVGCRWLGGYGPNGTATRIRDGGRLEDGQVPLCQRPVQAAADQAPINRA